MEKEQKDLEFALGDEQVVRYATVSRDTATQLMSVTMRYERSRSGEVVGNEICEIHMRWYYRYELEHLMHRAGFEHVEIYGDFDRSVVRPDSPNFVVVAR